MSTDETPPQCAVMAHGEQLPLLRDLFAAQLVDVFLYDTSMSELVEDAWKPWARRMRPHTKHVSGKVFLCAPACIFPDPQNHSTIRTSLANQLQAVCDAALTLDAAGIFLPIEAATAVFQERIAHYLAPLHTRLTAQQMQLIVHAGLGSDTDALDAMITTYTPTILLSSADTAHGTYRWSSDTPTATRVPTPIIGPFDEVNTYRTTVRAWVHEIVIAHGETTDADEGIAPAASDTADAS